MNLVQKIILSVVAFLGMAALVAQAAKIMSFSPQGEVAKVRQVVIKFDEPMVPMGDPNAPAPVRIQCSPPEALKGQGRWIDEKNWAYDFDADVATGVKCHANINQGLTSVSGAAFEGQREYMFNTGGPFVNSIRPWSSGNISEDQVFLLRLSGEATLASIQKHVYCSTTAVGESIPIKVIDGELRQQLMDTSGWGKAAKETPNQYWALQCKRPLSPDTKVTLMYDAGVESPTGIANNVSKPYEYHVRAPLTASFSCTRENANAACMPLGSMSLSFSAPVPLAYAQKVVLKSDSGTTFSPIFDADATEATTSLAFEAPFPEQTKFTITLPSDLKDDMGRKLDNADEFLDNANKFPLKVATDTMPALAKFATAPFGILELYAYPDEVPMVPLTVRNIEATLNMKDFVAGASKGTIKEINLTSDKDIIKWLRGVEAFDSGWIGRDDAARFMPQAWLPPKKDSHDWGVQTRLASLLKNYPNATSIQLPAYDAKEKNIRPLEVIGIPVKQPGYHVLELASPALGEALLVDNAATMYVRTSVLVTNLAVHAKIGRENSLVWVTRLNDGKPVANATVNISGCDGSAYFSGKTDDKGILKINKALPEGRCSEGWQRFLFISARAEDKNVEGGMDMAFTLSTWYKGIEPWRFGYQTSTREEADSVATTVFDRTLLRAGETVHMKHFIRDLNIKGFINPSLENVNTVKIVHQGSGQESTIAIKWDKEKNKFSATSSYEIPETAKLGTYRVFLIDDRSESHNRSYYYANDRDVFLTGSFQVEEFRLPVFAGSLNVTTKAEELIQPKSVPLSLQVNYLSGGGASKLPTQISAVVRDFNISFPHYNHRFSFTPPQTNDKAPASADEYGDDQGEAVVQTQKLIADKLALVLDEKGSGALTLTQIPVTNKAQSLLVEASFADPNGEIVTFRRNASIWPAAVIAGIRNDAWVSITNSNIDLQAIALDTTGKPKVGVDLEIRAQERITTTTRKRLVGGFYAYDSRTDVKDLGAVCSGKSDEQGLLTCKHKFTVGGNIELLAVAKDEAGRTSTATTSLWVTSRDELWFGGSDSDRIDLLPENPSYKKGDTARFQLRMPFRQATALVTVEREGILESHVMELSGNNPTIELEVKETWGPNVYVSALVLRGRLSEVPLYSFFQWGYQKEDQWWKDYDDNLDYASPTAMVDLSKPAYRMGVTEIKVTDPSYDLQVKVSTEKPTYQIREKAKATITVLYPDGKPAANADVALAVVDEALLELKKNTSWDLLGAMLKQRSWGVQTSTAQMEIIGRRHYGRKAIPAGGGGSGANGAARELFDTLLLWVPNVKLDAKGQATLDVPINDSLTAFKVVVIAADGSSRFGTGSTRFQSTQDLQLISGLPPVIRGDDAYRAAVTVRNVTQKPMKVEVQAKATGITLAPLTLNIPANSAKEAVWQVTVPAHLAGGYEGLIDWEISAKDLSQGQGATDKLAIAQRVLTGVPITVRQATLQQVNGKLELPVKQPADSIEGRGGIQVSMTPYLAGDFAGINDWFAARVYYWESLEYKASRAIATRQVGEWAALGPRIPQYLDEDGLLYYFIPRSDVTRRGSDTLTSYILAASHEASLINSAYKLPTAVQERMLSGLTAFVEGKIQRKFWSPKTDLDVRRLNAMEALSRYGRFKPSMLSAITIAPNQWPTASVIHWLQILQRSPTVDKRAERLEEAQQILRARINVAGTRMGFSNEENDYWWWLMWNSDINSAQLILAVIDESTWQSDIPRLITGFIGRQQTGSWHTSIANVWGSLALEKFSRKFENEPVQGFLNAKMFNAEQKQLDEVTLDWAKIKKADRHNDIGTKAPSPNAALGAPSMSASFVNNTAFLEWPTPMQQGTVVINQEGTGRPWATIQSLAAVPLKAPYSAGYKVSKTITAISEQVKGKVSRGDIWRIQIEVDAQTDMTWILINDPIPGGSTILGTGLGRDSEIAANTQVASIAKKDDERSWWNRPWLAYQEYAQDGYRAYYEFVPKGSFSIEYTVRLNNEGVFILPPTRVEAIYAPEMFGEAPNETVTIQAMP